METLHRDASLLAVAFLAIHVVTSVLDGFAPITFLNAVIPFGQSYRPLWLGLGAVALDLMVAVAITSMVRRRIGYGAWRATHWLAYASWPVALLHGLGTGSDTRSGWMLGLTVICILAVLAAVAARAVPELGRRSLPAGGALAACALGTLALIAWLPGGPLGRGWAKRAGTPATLLPASGTRALASQSSASAGQLTVPFQAQVSGTLRQTSQAGGLVSIELPLTLDGAPARLLDVRIIGQPEGSGVAMTSSTVTLGTSANPGLYQGNVTSLNGASITANVTSGDGTRATVSLNVQIDPSSGSVTGDVSVQAA